MKQRIGYERCSRQDIHRKQAAIEAKRQQVKGVEGLLQTHEALEERDHDYERHLRAKLRAVRNQLTAMKGA